MACNGCFTSFSLLRPEKGCPSCGFSYCSKCLSNKIYLPKLKTEQKVCNKCKKAAMPSNTENKSHFIPPDAYYKRMAEGSMDKSDGPSDVSSHSIDNEIHQRLNKLKEKDTPEKEIKKATDAEIAERLQKIKHDLPIASDAELHARLANLRGIPVIENKPVMLTKDTRSEQEQVEDLMKQYLENTAIDCKYKDEFDSIINAMEARLKNLKDGSTQPEASGSQNVSAPKKTQEVESEDEEESIKKIIEKLKAESLVEQQEMGPSANDELPFCEICNEDARMRCLGCKYLFCKRCFADHKDDDDGCDKYEPYTPPKNSN